jgi:hypothetical protein
MDFRHSALCHLCSYMGGTAKSYHCGKSFNLDGTSGLFHFMLTLS